MSKEFYEISVAGLKRKLPLFAVNDKIKIAAFIIFGDVELTRHCAKELSKNLPEHDILVTAEAKSIPLIYELASQLGENDYVVARKKQKVYMTDIIEASVQSITTKGVQQLFLGKNDTDKIKGKRVLIVDDVISTGDSLAALEKLVKKAGGNIVGKIAVLVEGDAANRDDIVYLERLPLFDSEGNEIK